VGNAAFEQVAVDEGDVECSGRADIPLPPEPAQGNARMLVRPARGWRGEGTLPRTLRVVRPVRHAPARALEAGNELPDPEARGRVVARVGVGDEAAGRHDCAAFAAATSNARPASKSIVARHASSCAALATSARASPISTARIAPE